jgi:hypothetical protein
MQHTLGMKVTDSYAAYRDVGGAPAPTAATETFLESNTALERVLGGALHINNPDGGSSNRRVTELQDIQSQQMSDSTSPMLNDTVADSSNPVSMHGDGNISTAAHTSLITLIVFIWKDSFLSLREEFVPHFVKGDVTEVPRDPEDEETASLEAKPFVFWNNGQGVCRLVPLSQLKAAFTACRPIRIHALQVRPDLLSRMFDEIFGDQNKEARSSYHVVGGLDSNSQGSNFLQWRIKEEWKVVQQQQPQQAQAQAHAQAEVFG